MVLLVIDTQKGIMKSDVYAFDALVSNIKELIESARVNNIEVIYVRHQDKEGGELVRGCDAFDIYEPFAPKADEKIFDKKVNSAFKESGLLDYLKGKKERELIITGLQSEYCIDANVKCGFEHGFQIIVPAFANSTVDNKYMSAEESYHYYNDFLWKGRYATCISMEETLQRMRGL
ncbi:cysteine hydrolase family protein [Amedibacillus sp. YH-ame6]